ncbi:hypothetical protein IH981_00265, partial [Patescibacteria group bacterium]|nr:hypothetical protein [Patescibacteria group bacterium]
DGLFFVVFDNYTDSFGVRINGMQELQEWFAEKGIEEDLCQLIWSRCPQIPEEEPGEQGGSGIVWRLSEPLDRRHFLFQI